jgi:integrase
VVLYLGGEWHRKGPKTKAGVRSITVSPFTADLLGEHLDSYGGFGAESLVFTNRADNPLIHSSFQTHYFKPALEAALLRCRFHDFRHTSVALAIAGGAHPKAIQARMGHSSINVTLDRYGHLFPELDEAIATAFDAAIAAARLAEPSRNVIHASFRDPEDGARL